jgi:hypothetical protein
MRTVLFYLALFAGQMNTMQARPVVRLQSHQDSIKTAFGGDLVELINAPKVVTLPKSPPNLDAQGNPWAIEVKNLGPGIVTVADKLHFSLQLNVGQTVQIKSTSVGYSTVR